MFALLLGVGAVLSLAACGSTSYQPIAPDAGIGDDLTVVNDTGTTPPPGSIVPDSGPSAPPGPSIEVVSSGIADPSNPSKAVGLVSIAIDSTNVYLGANASSGLLLRMPLGGGDATSLVAAGALTKLFASRGDVGLASASTYLYPVVQGGSSGGSVWRVPRAGGAPTAFKPDVRTVGGYGNMLCWLEPPQSIWCQKVDGSSPATMVLSDYRVNTTESVRLDATRIYFWAPKGVEAVVLHSVPLTGGTLTAVTETSGVRDFVVDEQFVYWGATSWDTAKGEYQCSVHRVTKSGGASSTPLAWWPCSSGYPNGLAVGASHVYFITDTNQVRRFAKPK